MGLIDVGKNRDRCVNAYRQMRRYTPWSHAPRASGIRRFVFVARAVGAASFWLMVGALFLSLTLRACQGMVDDVRKRQVGPVRAPAPAGTCPRDLGGD